MFDRVCLGKKAWLSVRRCVGPSGPLSCQQLLKLHRSCPKLSPYYILKSQLWDTKLQEGRFPQSYRSQNNLLYCKSQGRDQRICLWDLAEGRTSVTDSVFTENVGFCRCSLLKVAEGRWLMATAAKALEEVGNASFSGAWNVAFVS